MKRSEHHAGDEREVARAYRPIVQALIARYGWVAADEQSLLSSIAAGAASDGPAGSPERLVIRHYTRALHRACGPERALEEQDRAYTDLFSYLQRVARARYGDQAQELAQRAIELVYQTYGACQGPDTFLAFAALKLRQAHTEILRATAREQPLDDLVAETVADARADVAPALERAAEARALYLALARLPPMMRLALHLKYFAELDDGQIAERLQTSQANVRQLRSRGMDRLRKDALLRREREDGD